MIDGLREKIDILLSKWFVSARAKRDCRDAVVALIEQDRDELKQQIADLNGLVSSRGNEITRLEIENARLRSLTELRERLASEELNSEEFIRQLRDDWEEKGPPQNIERRKAARALRLLLGLNKTLDKRA